MRTWTLNGVNIPFPQGYNVRVAEGSAVHVTVKNKTIKQIAGRKNEYVLRYEYLTQAEVATLLGLLALDSVLEFAATDGSLSIPATNVIMTITNRDYPAKGGEFRENITVILTEEI